MRQRAFAVSLGDIYGVYPIGEGGIGENGREITSALPRSWRLQMTK
jgi:hypothetical protein